VQAILARWAGTPGSLLPILHDVQAELGYIPDGAIGPIALALHQSRAEVHGVVSFYHDFRRQPPGRHVLKICQAESCQALGSRALTAHIEQRLGCRLGGTAADGSVTIEPVYCLGNCACSPAVLLDGQLHGRVDAELVDRLLTQARSEP
jgi:formate dehydrogenase subunit gamma